MRADLKSLGREAVRVRPPPSAPSDLPKYSESLLWFERVRLVRRKVAQLPNAPEILTNRQARTCRFTTPGSR